MDPRRPSVKRQSHHLDSLTLMMFLQISFFASQRWTSVMPEYSQCVTSGTIGLTLAEQ